MFKITADPGLEHDASLACPDMFQHTLRPTPARLEVEGRAHETLQALIQSKAETLASLLERVTLSKLETLQLSYWTMVMSNSGSWTLPPGSSKATSLESPVRKDFGAFSHGPKPMLKTAAMSFLAWLDNVLRWRLFGLGRA